MSNLSTLPKGDSAWLLRKAIERIMEQVSVLETNIGSSTTGNSANTQIIFNDNGTLRGDTGLTYNKTTDILTAGSLIVPGNVQLATVSTLFVGTLANPKLKVDVGGTGVTTITEATITGDLTVRTDKLFVNATGVGIGNTGPLSVLTVSSQVGARLSVRTTDATFGSIVGGTALDSLNDAGNSLVPFGCRGSTITLGSSAGIGFQLDASGNATWQNVGGIAGTAMTLNANGLGVGVTPSLWGNANKVVQVGQAGCIYGRAAYGYYGTKFNLYNDNTNDIAISTNYVGEYRFEITNGSHVWLNKSTAGNINANQTLTPAMTLDASGNLLVGTTASGGQSGFCVLKPLSNSVIATTAETAHNFGALSGTAYATFLFATSVIGSITQSGTTGVLYNVTSDYRLKESVAPLAGGLARVNALKPSIYKWKSDGSSGEGFLAHELSEVVPAAVTGEKDAVNADGTIKSQGIDMSRIVPILVAAIQELTAEVNALKNA